jgi:hypothetical protein
MILLPRAAFDNESNSFADSLRSFSDLIATLTEVVTGSRQEPTLVYIATSDPIVCLSTILELASPFLQFYGEILDVLIKHLELRKVLGNIKEMGISTSELPEDHVRIGVSNAVSRLFKAHDKLTDDGRRTELQKQLLERTMATMPLIESGSRFSIAGTTGEKTVTRFIGGDGTEKEISQQIETTLNLEIRLDAISAEPALLIQHDGQSES